MGQRTREANHAFGLGLDLGLGGSGLFPLVQTTTKKVLFVGSSSEAARATGTGFYLMQGARPTGYLMQACNRLAARGLTVNTEAATGNQENPAGSDPTPVGGTTAIKDFDAMCLYDTRFRNQVVGTNPSTGCGVSGAQTSLGGHMVVLNSGVTGNVFIDIATNTDACEIIAGTNGSPVVTGNKLYVSADGGAEQLVTFGTSEAMQTLTITGLTPGPHRFKLRTPSTNANPIYVCTIAPYLTTATALRCYLAGARGWGTTDWINATTLRNPLNALGVLAPNVVVDTFGGNEDMTTVGTLTAFITRCGTWYDAVIAAGGRPVMLLKPFGSAAGGIPAGDTYSETEIRDARIALAVSRSIPYFDLSGPAGTYAAATAAGEVAADGIHYLTPWHARVGKAVGDWLYTSGLRGLV